jgi:hypothetical protein
MSLWLLMIIPIAWATIVKFVFKEEVTLLEVGAHIIGAGGITTLVYVAMVYANLSDTYYVHGVVTSKEQVSVPCEHSYPCRCRQVCSGSGSSRSCTTHCDTCYEHSHDYDWRVHSDVGDVNVPRVDRQGTEMPQRWAEVIIGEPFTSSESFFNYIKNSSQSLLYRNFKDEIFREYPQIYDLYRYDQIIFDGFGFENGREWQIEASTLQSKLSRKTNVLLIFTTADKDRHKYAEKIRGVWTGGRLNDVIVSVGVSSDGKLAEWVEVFTYGNNRNNDLFVVELRDQLQGMVLDKNQFLGTMFMVVDNKYVQVDEKDFEYLKDDFTLSTGSFIFLIVVIILVNGIITYVIITNDESERRYNSLYDMLNSNRRHF